MSISDEDETKLKEVFFLVDRTGKGEISDKDAILTLRYLGVFVNEEDLKKQGYSFNLEQMKQIYADNLSNKKTKDDLKNALNVIFKNNDGSFSMDELKHGIASLSDKFSKEDLDRILSGLQIETSGQVGIDDFVDKVFDFS
ncbi:MAG: hypothetical protein MJ252_08180 [archaeon]|nr:hypothetical protein [archaeon]